MNFTIRNLHRDDLDDIAWSGSPIHVRHVGEALEREDVDYLAIEVDGQILGKGGIDYSKAANVGTLWQLSVHPEHQSQGFGTALIRALEQCARDRECIATELSVEKDNPRARALYERLGYEVVGEVQESWEQQKSDGTLGIYHADCWQMRRLLAD